MIDKLGLKQITTPCEYCLGTGDIFNINAFKFLQCPLCGGRGYFHDWVEGGNDVWQSS